MFDHFSIIIKRDENTCDDIWEKYCCWFCPSPFFAVFDIFVNITFAKKEWQAFLSVFDPRVYESAVFLGFLLETVKINRHML